MKVGIVGAGLVGSTSAYACVMKGVGREIVLVDRDEARARAEAADILHAIPFAHPLSVRSGDYPELAGSTAVVIAAGVSAKPGERRVDLLERNAAVLGQVIPQVLEHAPNAVLVIASNPVDSMTHIAERFAREAGAPRGAVFGTGTTLDTARFRTLIGRHVGVDSKHVHAYVLGEHGDTEVLAWSAATVGGMPLDEFCRERGVTLDEEERSAIDDAVRWAAERIIQGKGATHFGVGSAIANILDSVLNDRRSILTVSAPSRLVMGIDDVTISLPRLVTGAGVVDEFAPALNDEESAALRRSAIEVRSAIAELYPPTRAA